MGQRQFKSSFFQILPFRTILARRNIYTEKMCRRRQRHYLATPSPYQARRKGCTSRRQQRLSAVEAYTSNVYYPQPPAPLALSNPQIIYTHHHQRNNRCDIPHRPFSMAALLLGAVGLGAQKIKEKRDERKQKKAVLQ